MEEALEHRYFKITTGLRNFKNNNKPEDEEPERPMRYQRISQLMNCYDDDEYQSLLLRQQDQFKCSQNMDRMTSQVIKKEKQLSLKTVMNMKTKRVKKSEIVDQPAPETLQEPENIAVKELKYEEVK